MVFDPSEPEIDDTILGKQYWSDTFYWEWSEEVPPNTPEYQGFGIKMIVFVDSDHAGDSSRRQSRTGFLLYYYSYSYGPASVTL